jgi:hypothetical protein
MSKKAELAGQVISLDPHPKVVEALAQLEEAVGGRDQIAANLQISQDLTVEETILSNLLADPANQNKSLAELCGQTGITIGRVLEMFSKAEGAQAYAKSLSKIYRKLPDVVGDVMDRALPRQKLCIPCKGAGRITTRKEGETLEVECLACGGAGTTIEEAELERQKIALQLGGFLKDKPGVLINSTTNNVSQTMNLQVLKSTPDFRTATDRLLYPHKEKALPAGAVDAEIVEPDVLPENS